jgi:hypothetical protein
MHKKTLHSTKQQNYAKKKTFEKVSETKTKEKKSLLCKLFSCKLFLNIHDRR